MGETKTSNFAYQSVNPTPEQQGSQDESLRPKVELGDHPQLAKNRGWLATAVWQIFALLWLVPVCALMYLNFTEYIIGASAWCPSSGCWLNAFNPVSAIPAERAKKFDAESHNLLGGLQFVAKGLEIWFGIIAAAVMYLYTMKQAGKREGLPIGYMTRPMEFADPITLLDGLLWKTGPSPFGATKPASEKRVGRRVWTLIVISVFLCALINLMGPATAVLVIPALQWLEMPRHDGFRFEQMESGQPAQTGSSSWFWNSLSKVNLGVAYCTESEIAAQNYSCTLNPYGKAMDSWINTYIGGATGYSTQDSLTFGANYTSDALTTNSLALVSNRLFRGKQQYRNYVWWVPSRQALSALYRDYITVMYISLGFDAKFIFNLFEGSAADDGEASLDSFIAYNKSLELSLLRNGPILGAQPVMWGDYNYTGWVVDVAANKQVRCYPNYDLFQTPLSEGSSKGNYTKCIRTGSGWNSTNKMVRFYTEKPYNTVTGTLDPGVDITAYSSDKAVFFPNGKLPSYVPAGCLTDGPVLNRTICPWEKIFTTDPSSEMYNRTQNLNTIEYLMANTSGSATRFVVDYVAYSGFTQYNLPANPVTNPASIVSTGDLPRNASSIPVDPAWFLAAWSTADGATLLNNRTSTTLLTSLMQWKLQNPLFLWPTDGTADYLALVPVLQTLSLLDYSTSPTTSTSSNDPAHPILQRWAHMYVWAYGLTSRTAHLGIAVAIAGCLVVVALFILGFMDRRRYRSPTQLLVAALEHAPRGEFAGKGHDELSMARVKFHVKDNDTQVGKFSFYEPDDGTAVGQGTAVDTSYGGVGRIS